MAQIAWNPEFLDRATPAEWEATRKWAQAWGAELDAKIAADLVACGETHRLVLVGYTIDNRTYPVGR